MPDGALLDSPDGGPGDAMPPLDAGDARMDAGGDGALPPMACTPVGMDIKVANESRSLARPVYVRTGGSGYVAGNLAQRAGLDNVYLTRVGTGGENLGSANVSGEVGALVEGGAVAPDGAGYLVAYSSNSMGGQDIYVRRAGTDGMPSGTAARVSNDREISEGPQVVAVSGGWVVVWRSRNDLSGESRLYSARVASAGLAVSTPMAITPPEFAAGAFDLVVDGGRVAVAYVAQGRYMDVVQGVPFVLLLDTNGAPMGAPIRATSETTSNVTGAIGAALRGDQLVAVWAENIGGVFLHAARVDLASRTVGTRIPLTRAGFMVSDPGITLDGTTGYAVAFRAPTMMEGSAVMMRLDGALVPRDLSRVGRASTGDVVRIASRGDGTFLVGWSDEQPGQTVATVQVMRCP
jgi:hypothetical protein